MAQFPLIDQASLVMIPGAYKEGEIYSQLPTDGSGDFTYTRGTDTATRVNENGLIEKETQNLLTHSGDLTNADWQRINSATYNRTETDPNGGSKAYSFTGGSTNSAVRQTNSLSGGVYTFSVYLKSPTSAPINIRLDSNNGTFENYPCALTTAWQRFEFYYVHNSASLSAWIGGGLSWTTGEEVHIAFPQLEQGLVARDYIETTTVPVYAGLTDNMPRLDYSGGASCPALLLEPQRSNVVENSEYHSGSTYANNNVSVSDNQAVSPEGVQNAAKIVLDSGTNSINGGHYFTYTSTPSETYTISVFAKAAGYRYFTFTYGSTTAAGAHFDLQEGVKLGDITNAQYTNTSASIEDYGNGWYRLIVSTTETSTAGRFLSMRPSPSASVPANNNYPSTGDGTSGAYIYGFQLEIGASYATSYIPTYGSAVTRNADRIFVQDIQDNNIITSTSGTLFFELDNYDTNAVQIDVERDDLAYAIRPVFRESVVQIYQRVNSVQTDVRLITGLATGRRKCAISWNGTSLITSVNGTSYTDTIDGSIAAELNEIESSNWNVTDLELNKMLVFPTQLTEADLNALTTL